MVGGFVQQQQVGGLQDQLHQLQPGLFPAGEHIQGLFHLFPGKEEGAQHGADLGLGQPGIGLGEVGKHGLGAADMAVELVVIGRYHVGAQPHHAPVRRHAAHDHLHDGGFAGAVHPQQKHALALFHPQAGSFYEVFPREGFIDLVQLHHLVAAGGRHVEGKVQAAFPRVGQLQFVPQPVQLVLLGGDGHVVAGLVEAALLLDDALHPAYLPHLVVVAAAQALLFGLPLGQMAAVVAAVAVEPAVVQVPDLLRHLVQEIAVVGDDDEGAAAGEQEVFQPVDAFHVQMVGGLVQQKQLGFGKQHLGQSRLGALAAGEGGDGKGEVLFRKAQPQQSGAQAGAVGVASPPGVFLLQAVLLGDEGGVGLTLQSGVDRVDLLLQLHQGGEDLQHGLIKAVLLAGGEELLHIGKGAVPGEHHLSFGGGLLPADDAEKGGLARAVGAHQADAGPAFHAKIYVTEQLVRDVSHA